MKLKKSIMWLVTFLIPALFFAGCISPNNKAFEAPPDLTEANTEFVDTFSTYLETYRFDSLNSTGRQILLAGKYNDASIGEIECNSYFQLLPESYPLKYPDSLVGNFESATLTLRYDYTYYRNDEDTFGLYKITENLNGDKSYYSNSAPAPFNNNEPPYLSTENARREGRFIFIDAQKLGQEIFDKWKIDQTFSNDRQFLDNYLRGFVFKSLKPNSGLTRFDLKDSSGFPPATLVISYRNTEDGVSVRKELKFRTSSAVQYYTINQTYSGPWANLQAKTGLSANETNGSSLVQAGGGLATKVTIPGIFSWKANQTKKIKIFKAELEITPNLGLGETTLDPPDFLRINMRPDHNIPNEADLSSVIFNDARIFSLLQQNVPSVAAAKTVQSTQIFQYESDGKVYRCNITRHLQDIIEGVSNSSSFNLYSAEWGNTFNRMFLRQGNNQLKGSVRLKIFYFPI